VDGAHATIDEFGGGLAGDVQNRRAGKPSLDQPADGVGRTGTGGGEDHAQALVYPGIAISHVSAAKLTTGHHEADGVAPADRVQHRDVVNGRDAEDIRNAAGGEELGDEIGNGIVGHVVDFPLLIHRSWNSHRAGSMVRPHDQLTTLFGRNRASFWP
jgi:hypothetical protein